MMFVLTRIGNLESFASKLYTILLLFSSNFNKKDHKSHTCYVLDYISMCDRIDSYELFKEKF